MLQDVAKNQRQAQIMNMSPSSLLHDLLGQRDGARGTKRLKVEQGWSKGLPNTATEQHMTICQSETYKARIL
jgi:hypothetical protein